MTDTLHIPFSELSESQLLKLAAVFCANENSWQQSLGDVLTQWFNKEIFISAQTSGSTGKPKQIKLDKNAVKNSALRTASFFGFEAKQNVLLPMDCKYIGAKMVIIRALLTKQTVTVVPPTSNLCPYLNRKFDFCAMVPLQFENTFQSNPKKLNNISTVLLGGAAISHSIETSCNQLSSSVYASYGMTETISHVALRKIENDQPYYFPLPGVTIRADVADCLVINDTATQTHQLHTHDIIEFGADGRFKIMGRKDWVINSGGVKISPEPIEQILSKSLNQQIFCSSISHNTLGQQLVLCINEKAIAIHQLKDAIEHLPKYHQPKKVALVYEFPLNDASKIDRLKLKNWIEQMHEKMELISI